MATNDERITELEIKASFTEDLLDQLNQVVVRQQEEIALLTREVVRLRKQVPDQQTSASGQGRDELPPHY